MKTISNSINLVFPTINNMRVFLFEFEKKFHEFSTPFTLIPVPDGTPPEIPRITATSKHGHSNLIITQQTAQIFTNYDDAYSGDASLCWQYFEDKAKQLVEGIKTILNHSFYFAGLSTIVYFDTKEDPVNLIKERFLRIKSKTPFDISTRLSYDIDDVFYVNMEIQNARTYEGIQIGNPLSLIGMHELSSFIQVTLDVNDRHAFNTKPDYLSDETKIDEIFELSKNLISHKIPEFIEKGAIDL